MGNRELEEEEQLLKLDLSNLEWTVASVANKPHGFPNTPASTLAGGCLLGGVHMSAFGVRPVPKFDILVLSHPQDVESEDEEIEAVEDSEPEGDMMTLHVQDADGDISIVQLPHAMAVYMMQQGLIGVQDDDNDSDENSSSSSSSDPDDADPVIELQDQT